MSGTNQHSNDWPALTGLRGKVILAGAGPGDPELLTIKALRYLQQADVVIADRLVSEVILQQYTREDALIISVGKQCRKGASTPQSEINDLLVEHAGRGKLVVRLKGGDASIFSNIDRKSTRLNSSHQIISYAVFCLKKKTNKCILPHIRCRNI